MAHGRRYASNLSRISMNGITPLVVINNDSIGIGRKWQCGGGQDAAHYQQRKLLHVLPHSYRVSVHDFFCLPGEEMQDLVTGLRHEYAGADLGNDQTAVHGSEETDVVARALVVQ